MDLTSAVRKSKADKYMLTARSLMKAFPVLRIVGRGRVKDKIASAGIDLKQIFKAILVKPSAFPNIRSCFRSEGT